VYTSTTTSDVTSLASENARHVIITMSRSKKLLLRIGTQAEITAKHAADDMTRATHSLNPQCVSAVCTPAAAQGQV
jgi:hypothetical protein